MKLVFGIILILSFTAISILISQALVHNSGHESAGCLASKILFSKNCLDAGNALLFISFHVSALKNFTLTENVFTLQLFAVFIAGFLLSALVYFSALLPKNLKIIPVFYYNKRSREIFFAPSQKEYQKWLSLHESRDKRPCVWVA